VTGGERDRGFESHFPQPRTVHSNRDLTTADANQDLLRWHYLFGLGLLALTAQLLHASPDRREIVGSAGAPMSGARSYLVTRCRLGAYGWPQYRQVPNPPSPSSGRTIDGAGGTVSRAHKKLLLRTDGRTECRRS